MWTEQLSVEQLVALNMGDEDWEDLEPLALDNGCYRAATSEVEKSNYLEAEPMGLVFNPVFDQ
jgi:hypothetical protein